jgi:hypothetical protein
MNDMILDAVVDPVSQGVYATLKRKMEAERQMSVPPCVSSNRWRYVMNDQPEWIATDIPTLRGMTEEG